MMMIDSIMISSNFLIKPVTLLPLESKFYWDVKVITLVCVTISNSSEMTHIHSTYFSCQNENVIVVLAYLLLNSLRLALIMIRQTVSFLLDDNIM